MQKNDLAKLSLIKVETRENVELVAKLAKEIWTQHYTPIIGKNQVDYMLSRLQSPEAIWNDISNRGFIYDLVLIEGSPAAYMASQMDLEKERLFLSKLYVAEKYRKMGIARLLSNLLQKRAKDDNIHTIWLTVNKNNLESIQVYKRMGFVIAGQQVQDIGNGFVMDDYIMQLINS